MIRIFILLISLSCMACSEKANAQVKSGKILRCEWGVKSLSIVPIGDKSAEEVELQSHSQDQAKKLKFFKLYQDQMHLDFIEQTEMEESDKSMLIELLQDPKYTHSTGEHCNEFTSCEFGEIQNGRLAYCKNSVNGDRFEITYNEHSQNYVPKCTYNKTFKLNMKGENSYRSLPITESFLGIPKAACILSDSPR